MSAQLTLAAAHHINGPHIDWTSLSPIVVVILALAFYPQWGLRRSQATVKATLVPTEVQAALPSATAAARPLTTASRGAP